jgi:hypothetical protein
MIVRVCTPPTHILFSKDTHALDEVIVHDSIIAQEIEVIAHKNNNLDIPHHKTRFFLLHTPAIPSKGPYR